MAASCSPVAQPSVRLTRAATWSVPSGRPVMRSRRRAESASSKASSAWRISVSPRRRRWRLQAMGGSTRVDRTRWTLAGASSTNRPRSASKVALVSWWRSSSTRTVSGSSAKNPASAFQERGPQPASVEGHQLAQLGRLGVHRGQSLQEALGEADRVVVRRGQVQPHEVDLGMGRPPTVSAAPTCPTRPAPPSGSAAGPVLRSVGAGAPDDRPRGPVLQLSPCVRSVLRPAGDPVWHLGSGSGHWTTCGCGDHRRTITLGG